MSDGFAEMITGAIAFFERLKANNTKAFYEAHKVFYRDEIKKPAELMGDLFAEDLARLTGKPHGSKLFRIHRDVRFSKDKTPYNTHLHLLWSRPGDAVTPAWFFGASPDYLTFGMGVMGLEKEPLTRFRQMVDARGDELEDALSRARDAAGVALSDWGPAPLKRVPKPYDPDHPNADLLKRKSLTIQVPFPTDWKKAGLLPSLNALVPPALPIWRILDQSFPG
jgi:uncharacterized protein (TIGR02453 family)